MTPGGEKQGAYTGILTPFLPSVGVVRRLGSIARLSV